jgi:hypothetical protein
MLGVATEVLIDELVSLTSAISRFLSVELPALKPQASARQQLTWLIGTLSDHGRMLRRALDSKGFDSTWIEPLKDVLSGTGQSIRLTRNEFGHPTGIQADQGQALELLNLFVRFARYSSDAAKVLSAL